MKVRVSAVSYSNTLPFLKGLEESTIMDKIDLSVDIPSDCAKKLVNNQVDLGLVPVAIIPHLSESYIVSDFCIGADGPVDTVMLYSDVPLNEIESVYLDYQSRTSVALVKILADRLWQISPQWLSSEAGYESLISGNKAGVVIGDRAFDLNSKYKYKYDLSASWKELTGLPFVFACWVSNKELPVEFVNELNQAFTTGLASIDAIVSQVNSPHDLEDYLKNKIDYKLNAEKRNALDLFLEYLSTKVV